jgi:hypothetical protein
MRSDEKGLVMSQRPAHKYSLIRLRWTPHITRRQHRRLRRVLEDAGVDVSLVGRDSAEGHSEKWPEHPADLIEDICRAIERDEIEGSIQPKGWGCGAGRGCGACCEAGDVDACWSDPTPRPDETIRGVGVVWRAAA